MSTRLIPEVVTTKYRLAQNKRTPGLSFKFLVQSGRRQLRSADTNALAVPRTYSTRRQEYPGCGTGHNGTVCLRHCDSLTHRRSQDFVSGGALFLAKKVDDLFLVVARLNIPPNLTAQQKMS